MLSKLPKKLVAIHSVHLATEALECAIVLETGEVVVCRPPTSSLAWSSTQRDSEVVDLQHIRPSPGSKLVPYFLLATGRGKATTCAIADSGEMI